MKTLIQLWRLRARLSPAEWEQLYQLVYRVIERSHCLHQLSPLEKRHHIDSFFHDKVFLPTTKKNFKENELFHDHALIVFFCRYLGRILDEPYLKRAVPLFDDNDFAAPPNQDEAILLRESGLSSEQVKLSARQFLQNSEEWVRLYLALHTCPDDSLPLKRLAAHYQIPAYHHRAKRLGITRKKGEFEKYYDKTFLGQWLISLGIQAKLENQALIELAFKILCEEALFITSKINLGFLIST